MPEQYTEKRMGLSSIVFTQWPHNCGTHKTDTLYINDLPEVVSEVTSIRLFTHDWLSYKKKNSLPMNRKSYKKIWRSFTTVLWTVLWGIRFSPSKCQIMQLSYLKEDEVL